MKKITSIFAAVMLFCTVAFASVGFAADPSASFTMDVMSKYVDRGMEMSDDSVVVQPEAKAGFGDLSFGVWGNLDSNNAWDATESEDWTFNEMNLTASLIHDFGGAKAGIGFIHYSYDVDNPFVADTSEVFGLFGLNTVLNPTFTVYRDVDALETWYLNLGVSQSFVVTGDATLDLATSAGYIVDEDDIFGYDGFNEGLVTAGLTIPFGECLSFKPMVGYSFPLTDDADAFIKAGSISGESEYVFGGASVVYAF